MSVAAFARRAPLLALSILASCGGCEPTKPDTAGTDDTGTQDELAFDGFTFTSGDLVPVAVTARWQTSEPATCTVTWGARGFTAVVDDEPSTDHEITLVGHKPGSENTLVVTAVTDQGSFESEEQVFTAGWLPSATPLVGVEVLDPARAEGGFTLVPVYTHEAVWISVIDEDGDVVWTVETGYGTHRVRLAPDGKGVLFNGVLSADASDEITGAVSSVAWDGSERWRAENIYLHHDFTIVGEDRFAALLYEFYLVDEGLESERTLLTDAIWEFDSAGDFRRVWGSFDTIDYTQVTTTTSSPMGEDGPWDWSHGNYLTVDPESGLYLVVLRNLDAIAAVDVETGEHRWTLGNSWGEYQPAQPPALIWPHSVELLGDQLWVFNQTYENMTGACSHAVVFDLDADNGRATQSWYHENEECSHVNYLGSHHPLAGGNHMVVWSQDGLLDEVTPEGDLVFRLSTELGWEFAYAARESSLYQP